MKLRKLGMVLVVALALGAVTAGSASAAATTTVEPWRTGTGGGTVLTGSQTVTTTGAGELVTAIGATPVKIVWNGVECLSCTIFNESGGAKGEGKLVFKNPVMVTPVCNIATPITTTPLKMDWTYMIGSTGYTQFTPTSGTVFSFTITSPSTCPVGTYKVTGNFFAKQANPTGTYATAQEVITSGTINSTAGGTLQFGGTIAELNGHVTFSAAGTPFGVQ